MSEMFLAWPSGAPATRLTATEVGQGAEVVLGIRHLLADQVGHVAEAGAADRLALPLRKAPQRLAEVVLVSSYEDTISLSSYEDNLRMSSYEDRWATSSYEDGVGQELPSTGTAPARCRCARSA